MVGAKWVTAHSFPEMSGGRKKNEPPHNVMLLAYRYIAVHTAALLYCCSGLVGGWWLGGGCTGWCLVSSWIVSYVGELFRAVGVQSPLHTNFNIKIPVYYRTSTYCWTAVICFVWGGVGRSYKNFLTPTSRLIQSTLTSVLKSRFTYRTCAAALLL